LEVSTPKLPDFSLKSSQPNTIADTFIYLRVDRKNIKVNFDDILFIESLKDYIKVVTKDKSIITKQAIYSIEENLPADLFIRAHRSFIVSLKR
jgi:DNA-binding LytR/AlgR family response regulator